MVPTGRSTRRGRRRCPARPTQRQQADRRALASTTPPTSRTRPSSRHRALPQRGEYRVDRARALLARRNGRAAIPRLESVPPELRMIAAFDPDPACAGWKQVRVALDFLERREAIARADYLGDRQAQRGEAHIARMRCPDQDDA